MLIIRILLRLNSHLLLIKANVCVSVGALRGRPLDIQLSNLAQVYFGAWKCTPQVRLDFPALKQYKGYLGTDLVILNRGQMTRMTSGLAPPSPSFRVTLTGRRLVTMYDLARSRPHTRRIFSGIGFRT
ncbi:hypothetical protein AVEN_91627-1 [Araneus ventricosus]|uniref:Uncharacterized protein n=1 Tax=Araneus ventricosus TaxID=182803 RepID=A0A4Y2V7J1_ARAVE|nr:hypothetical protein AVEN_91627-1 [Araneus ventricosus]